MIIAGWTDDDGGDALYVAWTRDLFDRLAPAAMGVYVNFLSDEGDERVHAAYGDTKLARLRSLKARLDPTNLFRRNQNITPVSGA